MSPSDYTGKNLKPWPVLLDHYMNEFYTRLEKDLIGIDGGNITAPLWLSGLEWGTSDEGIIDCVTK